jgi:homogentisate phytyltransferase / homogentisate geranylgeranyltransferase
MISSFVRFSRLHTVIGTTISITVLFSIAVAFSDQSIAANLPLLGWTLLSCLGANIYIVGLNQITDVAIDKINKPYLPLASGAITMRTAYWWIGVSVLISLAIAIWLGKYLLLTVVLSLLLGTLYSLPPIRLKRFYFWAAFCIIAVRGVIVNILLFLHFHDRINEAETLPPIVWLLTATIFVYSVIIAWFKDMPDMEGDARHNIRTLSIRLGSRRVLWIGNTILLLAFTGLIAYAWIGDLRVNVWFFSSVHLGFGLVLIWMATRVQLSQKKSIARYYQFIWVLFFLEYITFGLSGWV